MPGFPFDHKFLAEEYQRLYKKENIELKVLKSLTVISIALSGIGLLGLTISSANQKIKEVSIRKVHGASNMEIMRFITMEPLYLITAGGAIAIFSAWYFLDQWLKNFPYKISLNAYVFAGAFLFVSLLFLGIIVIQTWKVITLNPSKTLRHE